MAYVYDIEQNIDNYVWRFYKGVGLQRNEHMTFLMDKIDMWGFPYTLHYICHVQYITLHYILYCVPWIEIFNTDLQWIKCCSIYK
jgi:hypothetical protein